MARKKIDFTKPEVLIDIEERIRDGWDEQQIAKYLGYNVTYFSGLKTKYAELSEAIKRGRRPLNFHVENSLYKRATGLRVKTITRRWIEVKCGCGGDNECELCGGSGVISTDRQVVQEVESELPPDTGAAMAWLKTRKSQTWLNPEQNAKPDQSDALKPAADFLSIKPRQFDMPDISHLTNGTTNDEPTD